MPDLDKAVQQVHQELDRVRQVKKCTGCECLLDVLEAIQGDLAQVGTPEAEAAQIDMQRWLEEGNNRRHRCLGCEVCLPIEPYNQFSTLVRSGDDPYLIPLVAAPPQALCGCGDTRGTKPAQPEVAPKWPAVGGDYLVGIPSARVAICTLADTDLPGELKAAGLLEKVAIVGPLSTENLGIERVIRNLVANLNISVLILCGRDSRGHRAGQALLSLKDSGVDDSRRITGALGPRPVLKNVTDEELAAFRQRITIVDEIGTRDVSRLAEVVEACLAQPTGAPPALPTKVHTPKVVEAQRLSNREWVHDPEGFFLVLLDRDAQVIVCEHYTKDGVLNEVIRGARANDVANTAIKRGLLSRLDHAAYLGRELAKAETALALGVALYAR